jgi:hypothetical protein
MVIWGVLDSVHDSGDPSINSSRIIQVSLNIKKHIPDMWFDTASRYTNEPLK